MKQLLKVFAVTIALIGTIGLASSPVMALGLDDYKKAAPDGVPADLDSEDSIVKKSINLLMYIVGLISVVMMIVGGLKYVTSGGDAAKVGAAKNTIMYSIIGLVVAILSFAIVNFVVAQFITV